MPNRAPLSRGLRAGLYALLAFAALDGVWIGTAEWLVRSGRVAGWLGHRPERFQASFESLASPLPGLLVAHGVDLRGQTERLRWQVTADRAWGFIDPFALLTRELRFITLRGEGIAVRSYRIERAEDPARRAAMPPIPPFPGPAGAPKPRRLPWSWEFPDLRVRDVREFWLEEARVEGRLSGRGGFALRRRRDAEIFPSVVDLESARVRLAGVRGGEVSGRLRFAVSPYAYRGAGGAIVLPRLDARAVVRGTFMASRLADHFLGGVSWVEMAGPPAPFVADLRIEEGHLRAGSSARFEPTEQEVTLFGVALVGGGEITLATTRDAAGERCDVALRFTRFEARDGANVLLRGQGLHAELATRDLTLDASPKDLSLAFDLGQGELPDLADLGGLLPSGSALRLSGGHGVVTGSGHASSAPHSAAGKLEMRLAGVDVAYSAARLRGEVRATVELKDGDLASRRFALGGTEIVAERFRTQSAAGDEQGWWARASLPAATLELGKPLRVQGKFSVALRDTGPLVAVYNERRDLPRWAERALTFDDANAEGTFDWHAGELALPAFSTAHGDAGAVGSLRLRQGRADARLLLSWKALTAGIELKDGARTIHLRGARDWYEGSPAAPPAAKR